MLKPEIVVTTDFDGYFEALVKQWVEMKKIPFNHTRIRITAGPYRPSAVQYGTEDGGKTLHLDFYSALRTGFGRLTESEVQQIIELL